MEIILGDGTVITSEDVVFSYNIKDDNDPMATGISHDVWYDDICTYFDLTLKQAAMKSEKWYTKAYHDDGFKEWIEELLHTQYPGWHLVERESL